MGEALPGKKGEEQVLLSTCCRCIFHSVDYDVFTKKNSSKCGKEKVWSKYSRCVIDKALKSFFEADEVSQDEGVQSLARKEEETVGPFNADGITVGNFEGFVRCRRKPITVYALQINFPEGFTVTSPRGILLGKQGDWLVIGEDGEKYTCRNDLFQKEYEILPKEESGDGERSGD